MDYDSIIEIVSQLAIYSGIIALIVSVITEFFIKKLFKLETQVLNAIVSVASIVLTVIVAAAYFQKSQIEVYWYYWFAVVILGFIVACISMNGYDKVFSYIYSWIKGIFSKTVSETESEESK